MSSRVLAEPKRMNEAADFSEANPLHCPMRLVCCLLKGPAKGCQGVCRHYSSTTRLTIAAPAAHQMWSKAS